MLTYALIAMVVIWGASPTRGDGTADAPGFRGGASNAALDGRRCATQAISTAAVNPEAVLILGLEEPLTRPLATLSPRL